MTVLSPAQRALQQEAREFALTEVLPVANELDHLKQDIPDSLVDLLAARGYFGITIPKQHGGMGLGVFEYCLISAELARAWMSVASIIARGNDMLLHDTLDEDQQAEYLPKVASGEFLGAFALSEPESGSDAASLRCQARLDGDQWVIDGEKKWCGFASKADFILLFARTSPIPEGARAHVGISNFVIEKPRGEFLPGLTGTPIDKIGYHGMTTWRLFFDGCRVPESARCGVEGEGLRFGLEFLDRARLHTAARAIGLAQGALEDATSYAQQRAQFGQPIAGFQAIRFKLADMATQIEAARQLMYSGCEALDAGEPSRARAAMAKLFASEMAERVTSDAIQIFGGNGYTTEHAVQRHWRDARLTTIFEGTSEIQRRIISDSLLQDRG